MTRRPAAPPPWPATWPTGYVTLAGRAPYDTAAPEVTVQPGSGLAPARCILPASVAAQLGAAPGDLVELAREQGPAIRLWVERIAAAGVVIAGHPGTWRIRRLGAPP